MEGAAIDADVEAGVVSEVQYGPTDVELREAVVRIPV